MDNDGIRNEPDGKVDFIAICFRFANTAALDGYNYNGIAGLTGFRGVFGNGSTQIVCNSKIISASLLNSGTFQQNVIDTNTGLDVIAHEFGHYLFGATHFSRIGFHGLMGAMGNGVMSSFERNKLGWIQILPLDAPNDFLPDAITYGVAKKVDINSSEYFLIDNHQRISYYESSYRQYNTGPLRSPGTGVLITHCTSSSLDIESMSGRWNWKKSGSLYVYPFEVEAVNRTNGEDNLDLVHKSTTAGNKNHPEYRGGAGDYMNPGYFQIFSPWSNPSSYPATDLCIELTEINANKIARFYIHTQNAIQQAPSKPQNFRLKGISNNHPVLVWEGNIEPDIAGYNIYRSENGGYSELIGYVPQTSGKIFTDYSANTSIPSDHYDYTIKAKDNSGLLSVASNKVSVMALVPKIYIGVGEKIPLEYVLAQNYPNPFNPSTVINYSVKTAGLVKIKVYNILGSEIAELVNENKQEGYYSVEFNASNMPSGIYIYTLQVNDFSATNKMVLLK